MTSLALIILKQIVDLLIVDLEKANKKGFAFNLVLEDVLKGPRENPS